MVNEQYSYQDRLRACPQISTLPHRRILLWGRLLSSSFFA